MDKNTYLKELARELERCMPAQEREDTLRYYTEYFEEAGPEREAQVIEELGAPDALVRRLAEEGGWTEQKKPISPRTLAVGAAALVLAAAVCIGGCIAIRRAAEILVPSHPVSPSTSVSTPPSPGVSHSPAVSTPPPSQGPETPPPQTGSPAPSTEPGASQSPEPSTEPEPSQPQDPGKDAVQALEAFTDIGIQVAVGDVTIRSGTELQVEVKFDGTVRGEPYRIEYEVKGDTLNIVSFPKNHSDDDGDCSGQVLITIPEDNTLEKINISLGVGDVTLRDLSVNKAEVEAGVGDLSVIDTAAGKVELNTGVGEVEISGTPAAAMELATGVGSVTARLDCIPEECSWTLTSGVGSIQVDGATSLLSSSHRAADGSYRLTGATGVGSVIVTFK